MKINKTQGKIISLCVVVLGVILTIVITATGLWDRILYGEKDKAILPMRVLEKGYNDSKKADYITVDFNGLEYDVLLPEDVDVGVNDFVSVNVTFRKRKNTVVEMSYQPTEYYYLVTNKGYYAGHNKGVVLFTKVQDGAIRFSPEIVNGEMDILTGMSMLVLMNDVLNDYPEAEFVKEK